MTQIQVFSKCDLANPMIALIYLIYKNPQDGVTVITG
jgi:hypothetical protein